MTITVAFDKSTGKTFSWEWFISNIIMWKTDSRYSHVEVIIKDKWIYAKGSTGVGINELRPLSDKWDYVDVEVDGRKLRGVMRFIEEQVGKPYDYLGALFGGGFNYDLNAKEKWFCSEFTGEILKQFGLKMQTTDTLTPEDIYQTIT